MRLVIQRVTSASVSIESRGVVGAINKGLCVLIGIKEGDGPNEIEWYSNQEKIIDFEIELM